MSFIRFNHVFFFLMALATLSAFVLPSNFAETGRAQVQGVFYPVSRPTRRMASWVYRHFFNDDVVDARGDASIREENDQLRQQIASLWYQLDALKTLNADRQSLGALRPLCTPEEVIGDDSGPEDALLLRGSSQGGLRDKMAVLYRGGLAGRIESAGLGGARVRLITDRGFCVTGNFVRFIASPGGGLVAQKIACDDPLVEGIGDGRMVIRNLTLPQVQAAQIAAGDWVVVHDDDWETEVQGTRIGQVIAAPTEQRDHPMFAEIKVAPMEGLSRLLEVMVLTRRGNVVAGTDETKG